ncbi:MAG: serine hydrolase [Pseudomonadota bacterium]
MTASAAPPAEVATAATPLDQRVDQVIPLLQGAVDAEDFFDPHFLSEVASPVQMKAFAETVLAQFGTPQKILETRKTSATIATLRVSFEKAVAIVDVSIDTALPNKVTGFHIVPERPHIEDDSFAKIDAELAALPGRVGYLVESIAEDGKRTVIAGRATGEQFAIGSTFKLYILAELASQIQAGKRKWSDTIPLTRPSFSSPATQSLPIGTFATLEQLATWMIAVSDNAAADELLFLLGRAQVEARVRMIGHSEPEKMRPFLSTVEAFLLKSDYKGTRAIYEAANENKQRTILKCKVAGVGFDKIVAENLIGKPAAIDTIEWFASPNDIVLLMDHLRRINNQTVLEIMAKSIGPTTAKKWKYVGSKGGSELGVIAMSFLAHAPSGEWSIVTGSWNNREQSVNEERFIGLMLRLLDKVKEKK